MPNSNPPQLDWARIERWTTQIVTDDDTDIRQTFEGAARPRFAWMPSHASLASDKLRFLMGHWIDLKGAAPMPHMRAIDPLKMRPVLGYVMLLEPVDDGRDFRYLVYGSQIAAISEGEMTGRLASTLDASQSVVEFGIASYRSAWRRQAPLYTVRTPIGAYRTAEWHRLTLPLSGDDGRIARLIAGSVPLSADGSLVR